MITRIIYQGVEGIAQVLSPDFIISLQSTPLGDHECYVATDEKTGRSITISEKIVLLIEEEGKL